MRLPDRRTLTIWSLADRQAQVVAQLVKIGDEAIASFQAEERAENAEAV